MRYARNSALVSYEYAICIFRRRDEFRILVTRSKTLKTLKTPETFIPGGPLAHRVRVTPEPGTPEPVDYWLRAEGAAIFCVAPSTETRWAEEGRLACVRTLSGHRRYVKESVVQACPYVDEGGRGSGYDYVGNPQVIRRSPYECCPSGTSEHPLTHS